MMTGQERASTMTTVLTAPTAPLRVVPRLGTWVVCPVCSGPAHVVEHGAFCTRCTWSARGARSGYWCGCCQRWEGERPRPARPAQARTTWRCPACGRRQTAELWLSPDSRPARCCPCGTSMIMTGRASALKVSDGVDALYGLPFYLSTPCAGHTLWVANGEHAEYLLGFVRARLRPTGKELGHRLPAWVLSRKHRGAVMHALNGLLREARSLESAHRPGPAPTR